MKVTVLNGSPKGKYSVTLQSIKFLQKHFPELELEIFNVGQEIEQLEKVPEKFDAVIAHVATSELILWSYPVYTFLVPSQLMRFISLIFQRKAEKAFASKYTSQVLTSKHFFDHTAHNYIWNICEDLGMKHIFGHCADMEDLLKEEGRKRLLQFGEELLWIVKEKLSVERKFPPRVTEIPRYEPQINLVNQPHRANHKIVLVTDCKDPDSNLGRMIQVFQSALPNPLRIVNLNDFHFAGGCLGCFHCAFEGKCVYKDGFDEFHITNVLDADCVIYVAEIDRHWFYPVWKCYDDRQFYNGHRTSTMGKVEGIIISGPLQREPNLREVIEARSEVGQTYLAGIVTDESSSSEETTVLLYDLAAKVMRAIETKITRPANFLGVGGRKIFRDLIYVMRWLMQEDHRFYKKYGFYNDLPNRQLKRMFPMFFLGFLLKLKSLRKNILTNLNQVIIKQYEKVIEKY